MKTERTQVHFLSDVFAAVASSDLKVPIISPAHSSMSESQNFPVKPEVQLQIKVFMPSMHEALFWQGLITQSSMSTSQRCPVNPDVQLQVKLLNRSIQVPLLRQGEERHSFVSVSHLQDIRTNNMRIDIIWEDDERGRTTVLSNISH